MKHSDQWKGYTRLPCEQEYSEDVSHIHRGLNVEPTREELNKLSKACGRLWELDLNRLTPGKDYTVQCGEGKKVYHKGNKAPKICSAGWKRVYCGDLCTPVSVHSLITTTPTKDTRISHPAGGA